MKELDEYTAEVLKRADRMTAKRKARLRAVIGSACAAVLVCLMGAAAIKHFALSAPGGASQTPQEAMPQETVQQLEDGAEGVTASVEWGDDERAEIRGDAVSAIEEAVRNAMERAGSATLEEAYHYGAPLQESCGENGRFRLILSLPDGTEKEYVLTRGRLYLPETDEAYRITEEDYEAILEAAGLLK